MAAINDELLKQVVGGSLISFLSVVLFKFLFKEIFARMRDVRAEQVESAAVRGMRADNERIREEARADNDALREEMARIRERVDELERAIEQERLLVEAERNKRFDAENALHAERQRATKLENRIFELERDCVEKDR